jgi:uncharacterized FlaG/YvyC family protein
MDAGGLKAASVPLHGTQSATQVSSPERVRTEESGADASSRISDQAVTAARKLQIDRDPASGKYVYTVYDPQTNEIIGRWPIEMLVKAVCDPNEAGRLEAGRLVNSRA